MARRRPDYAARTVSCTSCGSDVAIRRPSLSGEHYCKTPACQAAKQKSYRRRQATEAGRVAQLESDIREDFLLGALANLSAGRQPCSSCGRGDAVAGLAHPTPDLEGACRELVLTPPPEGLGGRIVFAIWPEAKAAHDRRMVLAAQQA